MKMNRTTISVSISLFSSLILGSMLTQQVKADPTDQQPTTAVSPTNGDTVQNKNVENNLDSKPANVAPPADKATITQATAEQAPIQNPVTPQAEDDSENQTVTIECVDTEGNKLQTNPSTITEYNGSQIITGTIIDDFSNIAPDISGYTYTKNAQPFTVTSSNNVIKLIYTNDSLNYLAVNYTDTGTGADDEKGNIVYTDHLLGNNGDTVNIKDINGLDSHYEMSNSSNTGTYTIKSDKKSLPIYVDPAPYHGSVVQTTKSKIILNNNFTLKRGAQPIYSKIKLFSNDVANVDNLVASVVIGPVNVNQSWDSKRLVQAADSVPDLIKQLVPGPISDSQTGATEILTITYKSDIPAPANDKKVTATYQTSDGTSVGKPITLNNPTVSDGSDGSDVEASDLLTKSLPAGYEFVNADDPYTIDSVTDNNVALISKIQKTPQKPVTTGNSGNSNNNSGSSNHDTGEVTGIEENISTHPNLTAINVYDDNGNLTDETVAPNTDFSTDEKLQLDGKTYYRIAQNKWINADDIYIYYTDPTYVRTYFDSAKELVNSQDKTVSDRELATGSNWYSDRYTYLNDQKYYRVATNELVSAKDAFEYQPIDQIVQPNDNARLFDDRGNFVKAAPKVSLKTDKIATINGIKMYRVATNEWLPVNDVK